MAWIFSPIFGIVGPLSPIWRHQANDVVAVFLFVAGLLSMGEATRLEKHTKTVRLKWFRARTCYIFMGDIQVDGGRFQVYRFYIFFCKGNRRCGWILQERCLKAHLCQANWLHDLCVMAQL